MLIKNKTKKTDMYVISYNNEAVYFRVDLNKTGIY